MSGGRGFRHEEWLVHVLDWFAVSRSVSERAARELVAAAEEQLGLEAIRSWLPKDPRPTGDEELRDAVVRALTDGRLRLVKHGRAHEPMRSPDIQDLVDLIESYEEDLPRPPWIEVNCLGPQGESYAFARCRVRMPDGTERYERLDHRSRLRLDDVPTDGTCHFELSQDARPDGGRLTAPTPKAVVYELGTAAAVVTSAVHVLTVSTARNWVELEVVDARGRPVTHFRGTLRTTDGPLPIVFQQDGVFRADPLPDAAPLSGTLQVSP